MSARMTDLFRGEKVRLSRAGPETSSQAWVRWQRNTEMMRLLDDEPPSLYSQKTIQGFVEQSLGGDPANVFFFHVHTLIEDRLIGFVELRAVSWQHCDGWVGMAIGDRANWNQGYGSDALRLLLGFAFDDLNLHRVTLGVFAYNLRAVRAYEKVGFRIEGIERAAVQRGGARHDSYVMGILRAEWAESRLGG